MNTLKTIWDFLFGFEGRIGRVHFITFLVISSIISYSLTSINVSLPISEAIKQVSIMSIPEKIWYSLLEGLSYWMFFSHLARRVHDFGKSLTQVKFILFAFITQWLLTLVNRFYLMPLLRYETPEGQEALLGLLGLIPMVMMFFALICLLVVAFKKGTQGENSFGPEPILFKGRS